MCDLENYMRPVETPKLTLEKCQRNIPFSTDFLKKIEVNNSKINSKSFEHQKIHSTKSPNAGTKNRSSFENQSQTIETVSSQWKHEWFDFR